MFINPKKEKIEKNVNKLKHNLTLLEDQEWKLYDKIHYWKLQQILYIYDLYVQWYFKQLFLQICTQEEIESTSIDSFLSVFKKREIGNISFPHLTKSIELTSIDNIINQYWSEIIFGESAIFSLHKWVVVDIRLLTEVTKSSELLPELTLTQKELLEIKKELSDKYNKSLLNLVHVWFIRQLYFKTHNYGWFLYDDLSFFETLFYLDLLCYRYIDKLKNFSESYSKAFDSKKLCFLELKFNKKFLIQKIFLIKTTIFTQITIN